MQIPVSTYRLQFSSSFTFKDALKILPYLSASGISHIYASPVFKAKKGSSHGYDIVDHNVINPELGGAQGFEQLIKSVKSFKLHWIQDIVPNHMAYDSENTFLTDIFENGEHSEFFHFFDIDWNHPYENMKGKILAPFLGGFYDDCLSKGEIRLMFDKSGFSISYYQLNLPVFIETYCEILEYNLSELENRTGNNDPDFIKFIGTINIFKTLSESSDKQSRNDLIRYAKKMLWSLYSESLQIRNFINTNVIRFNGTTGNTLSFDKLDRLLSGQLFRLSFWKVAAEEINYRRFFTVNNLISLKVEDEAVFNHTHSLIFKYIKENKFDGLRIDHIDGLFDPTEYLKKLKSRIGDKYLVVEKILEHNEELPSYWNIEGTTGYEFLNFVNGLFCSSDKKRILSRIYYQFVDIRSSFEDLLLEKKRLIIGKHLAGNIDNLAILLKTITSQDRAGKDVTLYGLKRTLVEIMANFSVYRTYINHEHFSEHDKMYLLKSISKSREIRPELIYELNFIENFLLSKKTDAALDNGKKEWIEFIMNFQQYTGALMAKGFEDTFLYIFNRLISLNDVGGMPDQFGISPKEFHIFNEKRASKYPHTLNTTSTHDTKRGEDVRTRIQVLSEIPKEWAKQIKYWHKLNRRYKKQLKNGYAPDENDEYFLYQTLIGVYPFKSHSDKFIKRIKDYIIKSVREAKVHTAWIKPDIDYENACLSFLDQILDSKQSNRFLDDFILFHKKVSFYGILNSLSQTVLKITSPGIPDFYQGTELWDLFLVDPDNRQPVDYKIRNIMLNEFIKQENTDPDQLLNSLLKTKENGKIKFYTMYRGLKTRNKHIDLFQKGSYLPLQVKGKFKSNLFSFAKKYKNKWLLVIVPRILTYLIRENEYPLGCSIWENTFINLPKDAPNVWIESISGNQLMTSSRILIGNALKTFPVAIYIGESH